MPISCRRLRCANVPYPCVFKEENCGTTLWYIAVAHWVSSNASERPGSVCLVRHLMFCVSCWWVRCPCLSKKHTHAGVPAAAAVFLDTATASARGRLLQLQQPSPRRASDIHLVRVYTRVCSCLKRWWWNKDGLLMLSYSSRRPPHVAVVFAGCRWFCREQQTYTTHQPTHATSIGFGCGGVEQVSSCVEIGARPARFLVASVAPTGPECRAPGGVFPRVRLCLG